MDNGELLSLLEESGWPGRLVYVPAADDLARLVEAARRRAKEERERWKAPAGVGLGELLRRARKAVGLSEQELADRIDVNRNTVVNWESGRTEPTVSKLIELARVTGCRPESLLPQEGKNDADRGRPECGPSGSAGVGEK